KEYNYTQEQLAEILGVSRQSISKWESDIAYPETEKLIELGKLFECSMPFINGVRLLYFSSMLCSSSGFILPISRNI
ncbi:MAG: helix-turn-helix transcriptional regulator, partial [Oscillospiraceae bacterium]|nr:helix-turn-helix transcriptional regulator [Oscillospiraceae bacterium]